MSDPAMGGGSDTGAAAHPVPAHFHSHVRAAGCVWARADAWPTSSTHGTADPTRMANTACAESGAVVSKGPCTTSRCTIRPIPGDVVYGDDIEGAGARSFRRWPVADDRLITTLGASPLLDWSSGCSRMGASRVTAGAGCGCEWR